MGWYLTDEKEWKYREEEKHGKIKWAAIAAVLAAVGAVAGGVLLFRKRKK